jgi:hypothetical protein
LTLSGKNIKVSVFLGRHDFRRRPGEGSSKRRTFFAKTCKEPKTKSQRAPGTVKKKRKQKEGLPGEAKFVNAA